VAIRSQSGRSISIQCPILQLIIAESAVRARFWGKGAGGKHMGGASTTRAVARACEGLPHPLPSRAP
jgi:hypothetical protein